MAAATPRATSARASDDEPPDSATPPGSLTDPGADSSPCIDGAPAQSVWAQKKGGAPLLTIDVADGIASMTIPAEIFDDPNPLWKSFVVGYFIGDAPHVGSIHATVNRIWSTPRNVSKIGVQFIEKKTVLFRIENPQMRNRVIQRKYWHVADVPLVVHEWSSETAMNPPDLSALPMWVDLKGVPNSLFSHKGLKCLARAVGNFVKLHPSTEKCTRLDVARILAKVDFNKPLVEKISYVDNVGASVEIEVCYLWLPPKCDVCRKWGPKGFDCSAKNITILQKDVSLVLPIVVVSGGTEPQKNPVSDLLQELEEFTPYAPLGNGVEVNSMLNSIVLGAGMVEVGQSGRALVPSKGVGEELPHAQSWTEGHGKPTVSNVESGGGGDRGEVLVSPSRFQALADIEEEDEVELDDTSETEEGEIVAGKSDDKLQEHSLHQRKNASVTLRGSRPTINAGKTSKRKIVRTKDLKLAQAHASSKKTSVRKL
ncbi:hypothetical protein YC2023_057622 [Brassica napus]